MTFLDMSTIVSHPSYIGFRNYTDTLTSPEFWHAAKNGFVYSISSIVGQVVLGVAFALLLKRKFHGRALLQGAAIVPYVIPSVAGVFLWTWLLDKNNGVIDDLFQRVGLNIPWLSSPSWAMWTVVFISVWLWTPFVTITVLAALNSVPTVRYEASAIDGASPLQQFFHVSLPGIRPVLVVVTLLRAIWMFNKYDIIAIATGGGPLGSTEHLPVLAYNVAFKSLELSRGATIATLNMLMILVLSIAYLRLTKKWSTI